MAATQVSFTLEEKTRQTIESAVASGRFKTPDAYVAEAVDSYEANRWPIDDSVWKEAEAICSEMDADPSKRLTLEQVMEHLGLDSIDEEEEHRAA